MSLEHNFKYTVFVIIALLMWSLVIHYSIIIIIIIIIGLSGRAA
jgi:uncharacterized membrane protein